MNKKYVTIIGSRQITEQERKNLLYLASILHDRGFILRSGGAEGSDSVVNNFWNTEIIIPWNGFNDLMHDGRRIIDINKVTKEIQEAAEAKVKTIHPVYDKLTSGAKKMHTRNMLQPIGIDAEIASKAVIYIANENKETGEISGGTRTAVMFARTLDIPTYNLRSNEYTQEKLDLLIKLICKD